MDTLSTTILAGVVVALISAFATYYFSGRREKQNRAFVRQQERDKELNKRRVEAIDDIRSQAFSFADSFRNWTDSATDIGEPVIHDHAEAKKLLSTIEELAQQGNEVAQNIVSLEGHYNAHKPYLDNKTRNIIESFTRQASEQIASLSEVLTNAVLRLNSLVLALDNSETVLLAEGMPMAYLLKIPGASQLLGGFSPRMRAVWKEFPGIVTESWQEVWDTRKNKAAILKECTKDVVEAAKRSKRWDIQAQLGTLDAETERVASSGT